MKIKILEKDIFHGDLKSWGNCHPMTVVWQEVLACCIRMKELKPPLADESHCFFYIAIFIMNTGHKVWSLRSKRYKRQWLDLVRWMHSLGSHILTDISHIGNISRHGKKHAGLWLFFSTGTWPETHNQLHSAGLDAGSIFLNSGRKDVRRDPWL